MRTEQEILNDIEVVKKKIEAICGPSIIGIPCKYVDIYDENGNFVGADLDPTVDALYDELEKLNKEYRECGYSKLYDRGEYSGSSNGY